MSASQRVRLFSFPHHQLLFDAFLESVYEERPATSAPAAADGKRARKNAKEARTAKRTKQQSENAQDEQSYDIVLDFRALELTDKPRLYVIGSQPYEQVSGVYRPLRLRFHQARWRRRTGVFTNLAQLGEVPAEHEARRLMGALHVRVPGEGEFFFIQNASTEYA